MSQTSDSTTHDGGFSLRKLASLVIRHTPAATEQPVATPPREHAAPAAPAPPAAVKQEPRKPVEEPRPAAVPDDHDDVAALQLLQRDFQKLSRRFDQAGDELARYLSGRRTSVSAGDSAEFAVVAEAWTKRLDELDSRLGRIESALQEKRGLPPDALESVVSACQQIGQMLQKGFEGQQARTERVRSDLHDGLKQIQEQLSPPPTPTASIETSPAADVWRTALFGEALSADADLAARLDGVCDNVVSGDSAASTLVGQLLIYRHAASERRPQLLKDLGEAYYRCFSKSEDADDPFEKALIAWLQKTCEQAGFQNTIELIHPGERFDATRHTAIEKGSGGVEITQVHGWVVLRDRDKVYTKALVSVR